MKILTIDNRKEAKILRKKTAKFDFSKFKKKEIYELIRKMREVMKASDGVGLSANQVGLDLKFFVAGIPADISINPRLNQYKSASNKFYAIFNPEIIKFSGEKSKMEEGCLSVPGVAGLVERPEKITIIGQDKNGEKIKIKAWGLLARIFQHEVDHLNGILFIDKAKNVQKIGPKSKI
jgi:peptide deformylase